MLDINSNITMEEQKPVNYHQKENATITKVEKDKKKKTKIERKQVLKTTSEKEEEKKLVLFKLGNEYYGIDVSVINEIIDSEIKERLTGMPDFIIGVISLRGEVVPVVSLFEKFSLKNRLPSGTETILLTKKGESTFGILIDELKEVITVKSSSIYKVPKLFTEEGLSYIKGILKFENEIVAIIDIQQIMNEFKI